MDRQKEQSVSIEQLKVDLRVAKDRLGANAREVSIKKSIVEHPFIFLGAAFVTGAALGASGQAQTEIARMAVEVLGKELINKMYE